MTIVPSTSAQACSPYRWQLHRGPRTPLVFLLVVSLAVGGLGVGGWSIDGAGELDLFWGASGLAITVGAGLDGALLRRPNAEAG